MDSVGQTHMSNQVKLAAGCMYTYVSLGARIGGIP
jgi:hypothetical protein